MTIKKAIEQLKEIEKKYSDKNLDLVIDCPKCGHAEKIKNFNIVVYGS